MKVGGNSSLWRAAKSNSDVVDIVNRVFVASRHTRSDSAGLQVGTDDAQGEGMQHFNKSLTALVFSTVLATGCVVQEEAPENLARAIPTAESVRINLPDTAAREISDAPVNGVSSTRNAVLGELAEYYVVTRNVTRDLNGGAGWVLTLVHAIVQMPPTTVEGNVYTWGPGSDALDPADYRLIVTENDNGSFDWSLDGRSKIVADADFEAVVYGNAMPGAIPHRGNGSYTIDFDAGERVNPVDNEPVGLVTVEYDLEGGQGFSTLNMTIDSRETGDDGVERDVHFDYNYAEALDGGGNFSFAINGDLDDDGSLQESALIRSRWLNTGAGRADFRAQDGDLADLVVEASECWSSNFGRVYYADNQDWMPSEGNEEDCSHNTSDLPQL
jgi:hypothetical protein